MKDDKYIQDGTRQRNYIERGWPAPDLADTDDAAFDLGFVLISFVFSKDATPTPFTCNFDITPAV